MFIERKQDVEAILTLLRRFPVVGIIGARQVGKTTLARLVLRKIKRQSFYFDLENPEDLARLSDPMLALKDLKGIVVIDEIQRISNIFTVIRVLADRPKSSARFLVLGSASPNLLRQSAETLAGRIFYHELGGFSIEELGMENYRQRWLRGGFPRSYLARTHAESDEWRREFIRTFLERDIPQLGITIRANTLRRFWSMLAHYHGQIWNASEFARSFGVADTTVRNYLDLITAALVSRQLLPWHENLSKRQVKSPKVYISDSGLLHSLLGIKTFNDLERHPKVGASWEGFVIGQLIHHLKVRYEECFFWATHGGAELDLVIIRGKNRLGFEIKRTTSPKITPSMRYAISDLNLQSLDVIHAGDHTFPLDKNIRAIAFKSLLQDIKPLK
jgi:predicted AAA+ superfamily ATPase